MAAQTEDAYVAFYQNLVKLVQIIGSRTNNLAANAAGITAAAGGTGESASTVITAVSTFITNLG